MSAATGAVLAAIIEAKFKTYLIGSEYIQISPLEECPIEVVQSRCNQFLANLGDLTIKENKAASKLINEFSKEYKQYLGVQYQFKKRYLKLVEKGKVVFDPTTVSEEYQFKGLNQVNYNNYQIYQKAANIKSLKIVIPIVVLVIVVVSILTILFT